MPNPITVIERQLKKHTDTASSMTELVQHALPKAKSPMDEFDSSPKKWWKALREIDWSVDSKRTEAWFRRVLEVAPPPKDVRGLWFAAPEIELNPPVLDWCGASDFDAKDDTYEWAVKPCWPNDKAVAKLKRSRIVSTPRLKALDEARAVLGLGKRGIEPAEGQSAILYALPIAYTACVLADVFSKIDRSAFPATKDPIGVACAFSGGDGVVVGTLTHKGWTPGA